MRHNTRNSLSSPTAWMFRVLLGMTLATSTSAVAQRIAAADGPGSFIQVGGEFSLYQLPYGQRQLGGEGIFLDAHLYRKLGVEIEARALQINEDEGVHENTYLAGLRYSLLPGTLRPYVKLLAGRGQFWFPFNYATGSYFVVAPGFGIDWHVRRSRLVVRVLDVEYQDWPGFSFGALKPYGVSSGLAIRVF
jgi:hypothetical protein